MIGVLGMIMLVGIVVKNGIVLVDYINLLRDRGHELNEAIALSGESRLRPVLMTACTTILGMIPMAL
jgi:HAE1 family hydrophobic/amphiphilic exporter-1